MAHEIKDIKERLQKVAADGNTFGLQIIDQDTRVVHVTDTTYSHVNPSNVIGRQHEKQEILKLLLQHDHNGHDKSLSVVSILGFGGLGKTTLAKLAKLKHLRYLSLFGNKNLKGLPRSVCNLQNLETLNLNQCTELQEFPKGISKLISLRQLHITTRQLHFPDQEISTLTSLETLTFNSCDNLESLLKGIQLSSLKNLSLHDCGKLKSLSSHVRTNLENLVIDNCCELELSMGFGNQIPDLRLKSLAFKSLQQLVTLPQWL